MQLSFNSKKSLLNQVINLDKANYQYFANKQDNEVPNNNVEPDFTIDKRLVQEIGDHSFFGLPSPEINQMLPPLSPEDKIFGYHIKRMGYICMTAFAFTVSWIIFLILTIAFTVWYFEPNSEGLFSSGFGGIPALIFLIILLVFWVAGIVTIGILAIKEATQLAERDLWFNSIKRFFIIGIFIPLVLIYATFKTLSKIRKKYRRLIFYDYNQFS